MATMLKKLYLNNTQDRVIAAQRISNEQSFSNHGANITGTPIAKPWSDRGSLSNDEAEHEIWRNDMAAGSIKYVIRSYQTPIAWLRKDGTWFITEQFHSSTTSKHVKLARDIIERCNVLAVAE